LHSPSPVTSLRNQHELDQATICSTAPIGFLGFGIDQSAKTTTCLVAFGAHIWPTTRGKKRHERTGDGKSVWPIHTASVVIGTTQRLGRLHAVNTGFMQLHETQAARLQQEYNIHTKPGTKRTLLLVSFHPHANKQKKEN